MKYTVAGVQQSKIVNLGLDLKDASIITYIKDILTNGKLVHKNVEGEKYYWIDGKKLLEYLPVLRINNLKVLGRRFSIYENLGLIKKHIHKNPLAGSYTFIKPEKRFYELFEISDSEPTMEELKKEYEKLGLSFDPAEVTEKCPRENDEKPIEIIDETPNSSRSLKSTLIGTQKCPLNYPNNNTLINNTYTYAEEEKKEIKNPKKKLSPEQEIELKSAKHFMMSCSSKYMKPEYLTDISFIKTLVKHIKINKTAVKEVLVYAAQNGLGKGWMIKTFNNNYDITNPNQLNFNINNKPKQTNKIKEKMPKVNNIDKSKTIETESIQSRYNRFLNLDKKEQEEKKNRAMKLYKTELNVTNFTEKQKQIFESERVYKYYIAKVMIEKA